MQTATICPNSSMKYLFVSAVSEIIYLKPLKTQLIQILFFPVHSNVCPFICVFTSFPNVQERLSKTWARLRTPAKNFVEKCQIHQKKILNFF